VKARGERIVASKITDLAAVLQEHVTPVYQMEAVAQLLKILHPKFEGEADAAEPGGLGLRLSPQRADNRVHRVREEGRDAQGGAAGGGLSADENAAPNDREPHPLYGDIPLA